MYSNNVDIFGRPLCTISSINYCHNKLFYFRLPTLLSEKSKWAVENLLIDKFWDLIKAQTGSSSVWFRCRQRRRDLHQAAAIFTRQWRPSPVGGVLQQATTIFSRQRRSSAGDVDLHQTATIFSRRRRSVQVPSKVFAKCTVHSHAALWWFSSEPPKSNVRET